MSQTWLLIVLLVAGTAVIKGVGPVVLGGRALPGRAGALIAALAPALLAALIVVETFSRERSLHADERALGMVAAAGALALGRGLIAAVVVAAAVTAGLRALV